MIWASPRITSSTTNSVNRPVGRVHRLHRHAWLLLLLPGLLAACRPPPAWEFSGDAMGTRYKVHIAAPPDGLAGPRLERAAARILEELEALFSHYREDSEVSRFNALQAPGTMPVSVHTARVVAAALAIGTASGGAFDVTIAPLVELWGFGAAPKLSAPPTRQAIARLGEQLGQDCLVLHWNPPRLGKTRPCSIDLSALAKGYAVDRVADYLQEKGVSNYLVELGGEVRVRGCATPRRSWRVGIEMPAQGTRRSQRILRLEEGAVATSGDYRNYFLHQGSRYSHTLDPTTGFPVTHSLASVTVVAPSALRADAMATAINVLGPERGYAFAIREGVAAYFLVREEPPDGGREHLRTFHTPAFAPLLRPEEGGAAPQRRCPGAVDPSG